MTLKSPIYPKRASARVRQRTLSDISLFDLRQRVARVRAMDSAALSLEQVANRIGAVMDAYSTIPREIVITGIHRARKNPPGTVFGNASEMWCPPAEIVSRMGRLNDVHESVFYACNKGNGAALEVRPSAGDIVTVASYLSEPRPLMLLMAEVGLHKSPAPELADVRSASLPQTNPKHLAMLRTDVNRRKWKLIDDLLCELLLAEVPEGEECRYKATNALARILWSMPNIDGINYPSVATSLNCLNICLRPEKARSVLQADRFTMLRIGRQVAPSLFEVAPIGLAGAPAEGGAIVWRQEFDAELAIHALA